MATRIARCPNCVPAARKVTWPDGRRLPFQPEATYVGFLLTHRYDGQKRPPKVCPSCGTALKRVG